MVSFLEQVTGDNEVYWAEFASIIAPHVQNSKQLILVLGADIPWQSAMDLDIFHSSCSVLIVGLGPIPIEIAALPPHYRSMVCVKQVFTDLSEEDRMRSIRDIFTAFFSQEAHIVA